MVICAGHSGALMSTSRSRQTSCLVHWTAVSRSKFRVSSSSSWLLSHRPSSLHDHVPSAPTEAHSLRTGLRQFDWHTLYAQVSCYVSLIDTYRTHTTCWHTPGTYSLSFFGPSVFTRRLLTMVLHGQSSSIASCRIPLPLCCKSSLTLSIHLLFCRLRLLPDIDVSSGFAGNL